MARDEAYREAEKKIKEALKSGATERPLSRLPQGGEATSSPEGKAIKHMISLTSCFNSKSPSPIWGKPEGGS
jgi:hypothetical protein